MIVATMCSFVSAFVGSSLSATTGSRRFASLHRIHHRMLDSAHYSGSTCGSGSSSTCGSGSTCGSASTRRTSSSTMFWLAATSLAAATTSTSAHGDSSTSSNRQFSPSSLTYCQEDNRTASDDAVVSTPPFPESALTYDHYNGVTLDLGQMLKDEESTSSSFPQDLTDALTFWKAEGRKGIWIHVPASRADLVTHCIALGFQFHFVKENILILSQWLPNDSFSRLPHGPTHQIGIGALVLHPDDPSKMLVVQEQTGPAATYRLWKMPTGLVDPGEDIPEAAIRELLEETGLDATMGGIVCFRQAHSQTRPSDLFFVCQMKLKLASSSASNGQATSIPQWRVQTEEIKDIQWMSVEEYARQERWQGSPVYKQLNECIREVSMLQQQKQQGQVSGDGKSMTAKEGLIRHERLPLGFADATNVLFRSQL